MKRGFIFLFIITLVGSMVSPFVVSAKPTLPIGSECTSNDQCISGDCESSQKKDKKDNTISYCDCGESISVFTKNSSKSCSEAYGGTALDWTCRDGQNATWDMDFCHSNVDKKNFKFSIPPQHTNFTAGLMDAVFGETGVAAQVSELESIVGAPTPRITLPGLKFTDPEEVRKNVRSEVGPDGIQRRYLYIPFLGEYLAAIYRYAVSIVGIVSIAMIMNQGLKITISAGDAGKIQEAKTRLGQSFIGLLLAVGSYTLLYVINPNLVNFSSLRITYVEKISLADYVDLSNDYFEGEEAEPGVFTPTGKIKIPYFSQRGDRTKFGACGDIGYQGCGPTALAMVLNGLGWKDVVPKTMAIEWTQRGYRKCPNPPPVFKYPTQTSCAGCYNLGQGKGGIFADTSFQEKYKIKTTYLGKNKDKIQEALTQGKPIIASMGPSIFTSSKGHFIVVTGVNADGTISVNDPSKTMYCDPKKYKKTSKCPKSDRILSPNKVPSDIFFQALKFSTSFERKE
jgi:hypothetical protein